MFFFMLEIWVNTAYLFGLFVVTTVVFVEFSYACIDYTRSSQPRLV